MQIAAMWIYTVVVEEPVVTSLLRRVDGPWRLPI